MYRRVLREVAPVVGCYLLLAVLGVALALVLSALLAPPGGFTGAQAFIRGLLLGAAASVLLWIPGRYLFGRLVDEATGELRALPGGGPTLPDAGRRVLALHWHHSRLDEAAREIFDVLVADSPGVDPLEVVKAARILVSGGGR